MTRQGDIRLNAFVAELRMPSQLEIPITCSLAHWCTLWICEENRCNLRAFFPTAADCRFPMDGFGIRCSMNLQVYYRSGGCLASGNPMFLKSLPMSRTFWCFCIFYFHGFCSFFIAVLRWNHQGRIQRFLAPASRRGYRGFILGTSWCACIGPCHGLLARVVWNHGQCVFSSCFFCQTFDGNLAVSKATFCQVYKIFSESRRLRLRIPLLGPVQILDRNLKETALRYSTFYTF